MSLDETTQGNPICDVCGNSGSMLPMLLYSSRGGKRNWEHADPKEDHYVCWDCLNDPEFSASERGWYFVR